LLILDWQDHSKFLSDPILMK